MSEARVNSIQAIRDFRAALLSFIHEVNDSLTSVNLESRRSLEWILERQPDFWKNEVRRGQDNVLQAKNDLHRCRSSPLPGGGTPSCMEERKALDRAQQRLKWAEEKVVKTRQWGATLQREVIEYEGRSNQLAALMDGTMPQAVAFLDHALQALEGYLEISSAAGGSAAAAPGAIGGVARQAQETPEEKVETAEDAPSPSAETLDLTPPEHRDPSAHIEPSTHTEPSTPGESSA
jgi:hypothetical protein